VVLRDGTVVAEGWHRGPGQKHAEVVALERARRGDTLFVTLEPCDHQGRTPPCTEAIRRSGIRRVVVATADPDARNQGSGIARLRSWGIQVEVGCCEEEARRLNRAFFLHRLLGRSHVTLKVAVSADGRLAVGEGESQWLSSEEARRLTRRRRSRVDAILVGVRTVIRDDPALLAPGRRQPRRIVLDPELRVPGQARVLGPEAPTVIVCRSGAPRGRVEALRARGVEVAELPADGGGRIDLEALLRWTAERGWLDVLVEGGQRLSTELVRRGLVDRLLLVVAPCLVGGTWSWTGDLGVSRLAEAFPLTPPRVRRVGPDLLLEWESRASEDLVMGWKPGEAG
jgi:diaminohydroxyphosphoribosylaminopyrimidine deaminase/5-amino-6-(5-phosphoribosylamino)uracil reductase